MKLEDQRIDTQKSYESIDPQFLTFRHNSPHSIQQSGRSIYSQRLDYPDIGYSQFSYKSLDKYAPYNNNSQRQEAMTRNFNKKIKDNNISGNISKNNKQKDRRNNHNNSQNVQIDLREDNSYNNYHRNIVQQNNGNVGRNLRNVRSHQKYIDYQGKINKNNNKQHYTIRQHNTNNNHNHNRQIRTYTQQQHQYQQHSTPKLTTQLLKQQLSTLIKNIKRQQRRQITYQTDINQLQLQIQQYQTQKLKQQQQSIYQLEQINQQNTKQCDSILDNLLQLKKKNQEMSVIVERLEEELDSSEISVETTKQDSVRDKAICIQLKDGIVQLEKVRNNFDKKLGRLHEDIKNMCGKIQEIQRYDEEVRDMLMGG